MPHTYTLTKQGMLYPSFFNSMRHGVHQGLATSAREIQVRGETLTLTKDEPDLPEGAEVEVWVSRFFHCITLADKKAEDKARADHAAETRAREKQAIDEAKAQYTAPAESLIQQSPDKQALTKMLEHLFTERKAKHEVYSRFWRSADADKKHQSNIAYEQMCVINEAIVCLSRYMKGILAEKGLKIATAYPYSPNEGARSGHYSPGEYHAVILNLSGLFVGRLERSAGDALCKPADKFKWLEHNDKAYGDVTCRHCLKKMANLTNQKGFK
ncbi:hypothetical protein [Neptuniibacter sp. QD37_11]|uniref:hypothetical protein n=1 Tax=Neptuniibacter sp. QD37_11 TaxID=3398209 RepID=UPI0039F50FB2